MEYDIEQIRKDIFEIEMTLDWIKSSIIITSLGTMFTAIGVIAIGIKIITQ